ncbi:hypothetical protein Cyrtocomes_01213 [Candidatus Cyrtobacter comes]|uniref:Uncharacterized protein n=1 Tax=Candidatus Cyrtobacter comes TaxID=675776 RepID=A0ABU5L9L9_9RICK|nr:hypothetical protein [Candidatus Cyrtobacter comes]
MPKKLDERVAAGKGRNTDIAGVSGAGLGGKLAELKVVVGMLEGKEVDGKQGRIVYEDGTVITPGTFNDMSDEDKKGLIEVIEGQLREAELLVKHVRDINGTALGNLARAGKGVLDAYSNGVKETYASFCEQGAKVQGKLNEIAGNCEKHAARGIEVIKAICEGIGNGITSMAKACMSALGTAYKRTIGALVDTIKTAMDKADSQTLNVQTQELQNGMKNELPAVHGLSDGARSDLNEQFQGAVKQAEGILSQASAKLSTEDQIELVNHMRGQLTELRGSVGSLDARDAHSRGAANQIEESAFRLVENFQNSITAKHSELVAKVEKAREAESQKKDGPHATRVMEAKGQPQTSLGKV